MTPKINPTRGEKFKAQRRRDGLNLQECAVKIGTDTETIKHWEKGIPNTPDIKIALTKGEKYFIMRERSGIPLKKAAKLIGISHITLIKLEKSKENHKLLNDFYSNYNI